VGKSPVELPEENEGLTADVLFPDPDHQLAYPPTSGGKDEEVVLSRLAARVKQLAKNICCDKIDAQVGGRAPESDAASLLTFM
jgi:hypothetical protein